MAKRWVFARVVPGNFAYLHFGPRPPPIKGGPWFFISAIVFFVIPSHYSAKLSPEPDSPNFTPTRILIVSVADIPVRRPNIPAPVDGGEYEYSWQLSSYDGLDGVESRLRREEGPIDFCEETAFEAIKAGFDPREVEAAFNAADVARREVAGRSTGVAPTDDQEDWETNTPIGQDFATLTDIMDALDSRSLAFDFQSYLAAHPYQSLPRSDFRAARDGPWFTNDLLSTATVEEILFWRTKYQIPYDVHFYVPEPNERAENPPAGMVAIDVWLLEAGLRFPLHYAVTNLLNAWTLAPLQLTPHSWLQIFSMYTLFGGYRLYRLPNPGEMNFLFKLVALSDAHGGYYVQSRGKKVIMGVPNRHRGDRSKWFWVAGSWKTVSSDRPTVGLDIPTRFGEKPPRPRAPVLKNLSLDFRAVWERIRRIAPDVRDVSYLNNEGRRIAARVFSFPRYLSISGMKMAHDAGVLGRLRLASRTDRAPTAAAHPPLEKKMRDALGPSTEHRSLEEEVPPLVRDNKKKACGGRTETCKKGAPSSDRRAIVEGQGGAGKNDGSPGRAKTGKGVFRMRLGEICQAREDDRNCPALVVDFLSSRSPQHESDIPNHVARAMESLPQAWTLELESVARRGFSDSVQATVALALQAATMATKVAAEYERRPSVSSLQADLQISRKESADYAERLMNMEKASLAAEARAVQDREQAKATIEGLERSLKDSRSEVTDLTGSLERLAGDLKAAQAEADLKTAELAKREAELQKLAEELAGYRAEKEKAEKEPSVGDLSEFAYYMAYVDAVRAAKVTHKQVGEPMQETLQIITQVSLTTIFIFGCMHLITFLIFLDFIIFLVLIIMGRHVIIYVDGLYS
ncbi:hypothetical protein OROHE_010612 [Orobanche hederae]